MAQQNPPAGAGGEEGEHLADGDSTSRNAARLRNWAGNLLVAAILVAAAVGFGGQLFRWWKRPAWSPEEQRQQPVTQGRGASPPPSLAIGEAPFQFEEAPFHGDRAAVMQSLQNLCQATAKRVMPFWAAQPSRMPPLGPSEFRLIQYAGAPLDGLAAGEWRLYEHAGPMPMVVVIGAPPEATPGGGEPPPSSEFPLGTRVICWGFAIAGCGDDRPATGGASESDGCWTTFLCSRNMATMTSPIMALLPDLPAELDRKATMGLEGGVCVCNIAGQGAADHWRRRFDGWYAEREGARRSDWRDVDGVWNAHYIEPAMTVDISFHVGQQDKMAGVVIVRVRTHPRPEAK